MIKRSASAGLLIACAVFAVHGDARARERRSHAAIAAFKREQPCPATGAARGRCPGFVIDHVRPLCAGGADAATNMQWQTVGAAKAKDRIERNECRRHQ
jgi:hypothetical protein